MCVACILASDPRGLFRDLLQHAIRDMLGSQWDALALAAQTIFGRESDQGLYTARLLCIEVVVDQSTCNILWAEYHHSAMALTLHDTTRFTCWNHDTQCDADCL